MSNPQNCLLERGSAFSEEGGFLPSGGEGGGGLPSEVGLPACGIF